MNEKDRKPWSEKIRPYFQAIVMTLLLAVVSAIFIKGPLLLQDIDDRAFKQAETRMKTEQFMEEVTDKEAIEEYIEHVKHPNIHLTERAKDSIYVRRVEFEDTYKANTIDIYNIRKDFQELKKETRQRDLNIQSTLKVIEWKIDQLEK